MTSVAATDAAAMMVVMVMVMVAATSRHNFKQRPFYQNNGCELMSAFKGVDCYYFFSSFLSPRA